MNIQQVQSFTIFNFQTHLISEHVRNTFDGGFMFEQRTQNGKILHKFNVIESTAELALGIARSMPELCSVEIETRN
jgi:hypothetical protein